MEVKELLEKANGLKGLKDWSLTSVEVAHFIGMAVAVAEEKLSDRDEIVARMLHLAYGWKKQGKVFEKMSEIVESLMAFPTAGESVIRIVEADRDRLQQEMFRLANKVCVLEEEILKLKSQNADLDEQVANNDAERDEALEKLDGFMKLFESTLKTFEGIASDLGNLPTVLARRDAAVEIREDVARARRVATLVTGSGPSIQLVREEAAIWRERSQSLAKLLDGCYGVCAVCQKPDHITSEHAWSTAKSPA